MNVGWAMRLLDSLLDLAYPRVCGGCGAGVRSAPAHICWDCRSAFLFIADAYCALCGDAVDGAAGNQFNCSTCTDRRPAFDMARSAVRYRGPVQRALQAFKYDGAVHLRRDLTVLLAACVRTHYPGIAFDAVVFVPLHQKRERERTYNQSRLLAGGLARELGVSLMPNGLRRVRSTATQTHLSAAERRRNVQGAFAAAEPSWVEGRRLLLVDDVMTTGATVDQCARALKHAGAAGVWVATVARG